MRDPRVPAAKKLAALVAGVGLTMVLVLLEVPLEGILGFIAPVIGFAADAMVDGAEFLVVPLVIAVAILPYLVKLPVGPEEPA